MAKYREKPIIIDAYHWQGTNLSHAKSFCKARGLPNFHIGSRKGVTGLIIPTKLYGDMVAQYGDWIIKGVKGEYYPCKPEIFKATYEKVE